MGVVLPTEKKTADTGFPDRASWLVFGAPKVGKTSFAAQWPECLILDLENDGTRYIEGAYVAPVQSLGELRDVMAQLAKMDSDESLPYQTIAIDTIDVVNDWAEEETCRELKLKQMGEANYGLDWGQARNTTLNVIRAFAKLPVNLLVVSHSRWAIVNEVAVGHTIDLPGKLARFTMAEVENIIFIQSDRDGDRSLIFRPINSIEAGSRHPVLASAGECEFGYDALRALFEEGNE